LENNAVNRSIPFRLLTLAASVSLALLSSMASAQPNAASSDAGAATANAANPGQAAVEEVIVFGRNTELVGKALAATEGSIGGADLLIRPMFKTAELLESMPGMVAVQHSGSGKANQYFLRGFNLDHGTDYTVILDGIPLNMRSHGHGQGYLDVNGMIPETVDRIDYRKGPYRADLGDFAVAGASLIKTIDRLESSFASAETGVDGWQRYAGGFSQEFAGGDTLTMVGEHKQYDGPWQNSEDLEHYSFWSKYLQQTSFGQAIFTLSGYDANWNPTEQVPERAFGSAVCHDEFCSLDPTADGNTTRWIATSQLQGSDWNVNAYAQYYDWAMKSNPTYDFQIGQFDKRWTVGGAADKTLVDNDTWQVVVGGNLRYDDASKVGVSEYNKAIFVAPIADNAIKEGSLGGFMEGTWFATDKLRVLGGLRADYYDFDVVAHTAGSSAGQLTDNRTSPKLGLAYQAADALELYANWGRGFHSNDARGVVNAIDPVPGLSPGTGYELGGRTSIGEFKFTAAYWWLEQSSELIFIGDSNAVEPKGASKREGLELTMFWQPLDWLGVDAVYTTSEARYVSNPDGLYVENSLEEAAQIGITATKDAWDFSARLRHMGPYALLADNSERADSLTTLNVRGAHHWNALTVYAELINALDSKDKEIVYNYPAYVQGLDPVGLTSEDIDCLAVNCRMSRITTPRTFRVGVSYKFF
jgi:outer membrane receptor protein involved in Fe transport